MNLVPSGVPVSIEVTYQDPGLNVGLLLFDDSGVAPVQVGSMISMLNWVGSSYRAKLSALTAGTSYLIHKAVYTDNTFTTIDDTYSESSEALRAEDIAGLVLNALTDDYDLDGSIGEAIGSGGSGGSGSSGGLFPITMQVSLETDVSMEIERECMNSSCSELGCSTTCDKGIIYQSGDTPVNFRMRDGNGNPLDLTNATEIWALFPNATGGPLIKKFSLSEITKTNAGGGLFSTTILQAQAALLKAGLIDIEVRITIAGKITISQELQALEVKATLFPGS